MLLTLTLTTKIHYTTRYNVHSVFVIESMLRFKIKALNNDIIFIKYTLQRWNAIFRRIKFLIKYYLILFSL